VSHRAAYRECTRCRSDTIGERSLRPRQIGHVRAGALGTSLPCPAPASCHPVIIVMSEAKAMLHADSTSRSCTTDIWNRVAGPIPGAVPLVHRRGDLRRALVGAWRAGLDIPAAHVRCNAMPTLFLDEIVGVCAGQHCCANETAEQSTRLS
jgi:hypothetical protein